MQAGIDDTARGRTQRFRVGQIETGWRLVKFGERPVGVVSAIKQIIDVDKEACPFVELEIGMQVDDPKSRQLGFLIDLSPTKY